MEDGFSNDEENVPINGELDCIICRAHKESCNYYCNVCGFPICSKCVNCLKTHDVMSIDHRVLKRRNELFDMSSEELLAFFEYIENWGRDIKSRINTLKNEMDFVETRIHFLEQNRRVKKNGRNNSKDKLQEMKQMMLDISGSEDSSMAKKLSSAASLLNKASENNNNIEKLKEEKRGLYEQYQKYLEINEIYEYIKTFDKTDIESMTDVQLRALAMVKYIPYNVEDKIINTEDFEAFEGVSKLSHFSVFDSERLEFKELILGVQISSFKPLQLSSNSHLQTGKMSNVRTTISPLGILYYICFETDDIYTINLNSLERGVICDTNSHKFIAAYNNNIYIFGYKHNYMISMKENELLKKHILCQDDDSNKVSCSNVNNYNFSSDLSNISGKVYYCNEENKLCCFHLEKGNEEVIRDCKTFGIVNTLSVQFQNVERVVYDASKTVCVLKDGLKQSVVLRSKLIPQYMVSLKNNRIQDSLLMSINGDVMWRGKIVFGRDSCVPRFGFSLCRLYKNVFILYNEDKDEWGCLALKCT